MMTVMESKSPDTHPCGSGGEDDVVLLHRFCEQADAVALETVFRRHATMAYHLALKTCGNTADAEDCVQTAFCQILRQAGQFKGQSSVRGWIMSIVVNSCRMKMRSEACRREHERSAVESAAKDCAPDGRHQELLAGCLNCLEQLPERYRLPVFLRYIAGLSYSEVASALSLSEDAVRKQTSRGIESIREALVTAGFAASGAVIPEVLRGATLSPAPAALTASFNGLIVHGAAKSTGATVAKGLFTSLMAKVAAGAAVIVLAAAAVHFHGRNDRRGEGEAPPAAGAGSPVIPLMDARLTMILDRKISVVYRRDLLPEILNDLEKRVGLRSSYATPVDTAFMFTLEDKSITVRSVLTKLAAAGNFELDFHGDTAVFWRRADDQTLAALQKQLKEGDADARCAAVCDLAQLGDKRAVPAVISALSDSDVAVVHYALSSLWCFPDRPAAVAEPLLKLRQAPQNFTQAQMIDDLLARTGDDRFLDILVAEAQAQPRLTPTYALGQMPSTRAITVLIGLVKGSDTAVRLQAINALAGAHQIGALETLAEYARKGALPAIREESAWNGEQIINTVPWERTAAIQGLLQMDWRLGLKALPSYLEDSNVHCREAVISALSEIRDPASADELIGLYKGSAPDVKDRIVTALGRMREAHTADFLLEICSGPKDQITPNVIRALGDSRDERGVPLLISFLQNPDVQVRANALRGLGANRSVSAADALKAFSQRGDSNLQTAVLEALMELRTPEAADLAIAVMGKSQVQLPNNAGLINRAHIVDVLILMLSRREAYQSGVAYILAGMGDPHGNEALLNILTNGVPSLKGVATKRDITVDGEIPMFDDVEGERRWDIANAMVNASKGVPNPRLIVELLSLMNSAKGSLRKILICAVNQSEDPRVEAPLIALLRDPDSQIGHLAANELGLFERASTRARTALEEYRKTHPAFRQRTLIERPVQSTQPERTPAPASGEF
jgi:RNA polymerase sigma factor (sigma-70 family)